MEALVRWKLTTEESTWVVPLHDPHHMPFTIVTGLTSDPEVLEKRTSDERGPLRQRQVTVALQD